ncbi:MAG: hypothetical protein IJI38_09725, partial [Clostridia bacterium]|nr:hypothetical protein [Clostridia bacterium]
MLKDPLLIAAVFCCAVHFSVQFRHRERASSSESAAHAFFLSEQKKSLRFSKEYANIPHVADADIAQSVER